MNIHYNYILPKFQQYMRRGSVSLIAGAVWVFLGVLAGTPDTGYTQTNTDNSSEEKKYEFRRQEVFKYSNRGRRDPFKPLVSEGIGEIKTDLLNIEEATLTGIIWMGDHMVALFKDNKGKSYYMKKGDAVYKGRILEIQDNSVIVSISEFGASRRLELKVTEHVSEGSGG